MSRKINNGEEVNGAYVWDVNDFGVVYSARLRAVRKKLGLTQADLAELSGVPTATISSYEMYGVNTNGLGKRPSLHNAISIAKAVDMPLDYFFDANTEVKSCDSVVRLLSHLERQGVQCYEVSEVDGHTVVVPNANVDKFLSGKAKMKALVEEGIISAVMFDEWVAEQMDKLGYTTA